MRVQVGWGLLGLLVTCTCGLDRSAISNGAIPRPAGPIDAGAEGSVPHDAGVPERDDAARTASAAADAGSTDGGARTDARDSRPLVRTAGVADIPSGTTKLLGDPTAAFGLTMDGTIWILEEGATSVRQLVASGHAGSGMAVAITPAKVFWTDATAGTLHRADRDGSSDVVLASGLRWPGLVTADDSRVYWVIADDATQGEGGGQIESLPLEAIPGDPPQVLNAIDRGKSVSSMAAAGGVLYWTPFDSVGATMYYASLVMAPVSALLAGGTGTAVPGIIDPYGLVAVDHDIYFGYSPTRFTTIITRVSDQALVSVLPFYVGLAGVAITADCLLASGAGENLPQELYATPLLGSPSGLVVVATDLQTPAVITPWGVTYVNTAGALVAFPAEQLWYVLSGLPPP